MQAQTGDIAVVSRAAAAAVTAVVDLTSESVVVSLGSCEGDPRPDAVLPVPTVADCNAGADARTNTQGAMQRRSGTGIGAPAGLA